ncbi:ABC transporter permease [Filobacillus milosensis]|uniref:ABC transporter permease n=1 Tax=Filobacillus milosensis TaxID=94137 RepID=A0A4Y8IT93_9BACI|nr:ABC transporter permease [Filobacillus milosensis]TFB22142.1 ABC transporter permease [Filobacillus milosensis]
MIFHLWRYEWKRMFKHPGLFLFVLIFPIALVGVLGLFIYSYAQEELDSVKIVVLDEDQTFETNALIKQLQKDDTIDGDVEFIKGERTIEYYLENPDSYAAIVQVPEGFTKQLRSGVNETINVYLNEDMPLASNLAYILFESGQDYITAAQTGVNTVNHFYIQDIEEKDERRRWSQQMTIHFTMYALDRNKLFTEKGSTEQGLLAWSTNLYLATVSILLLLTYIMLTLTFNRKDQPIIQDRLRLISVTKIDQYLAKMFFHISFLILYVGFISWGLIELLFNTVSFNWLILVQWLIVVLLLSFIYLFSHLVLKQMVLGYVMFLLLSVMFLIISGVIIPPSYLTDQVSMFSLIYVAFNKIWIEHTLPIKIWLQLIVGFLILIGLILPFRKVGSRA